MGQSWRAREGSPNSPEDQTLQDQTSPDETPVHRGNCPAHHIQIIFSWTIIIVYFLYSIYIRAGRLICRIEKVEFGVNVKKKIWKLILPVLVSFLCSSTPLSPRNLCTVNTINSCVCGQNRRTCFQERNSFFSYVEMVWVCVFRH